VTNFYRFLLKKVKKIDMRILIKVYGGGVHKYAKKLCKKSKKNYSILGKKTLKSDKKKH
jgi:hypothetical protein